MRNIIIKYFANLRYIITYLLSVISSKLFTYGSVLSTTEMNRVIP